MGLDSVRAASRVVGRRTTLRYLAAGVGASLLAACKGNGTGGSSGESPGESDTGSGERLEVEYTKQAGVRIRHTETSGSMTVHHCVRA
ncbi:hypothetical protein D9753_20125 [Streptomyces dangxiongensis]|uniref:Uncharacterized protein n=1 Tax=Streptomyces dangxiongensis TaxID=1442032 RepID=A0A3G2JMJ0_9ACTN|nr:hypothetical protein [Streptomyces dangxiongensis]AYN40807.1 hypothetical protein D9753_20125 [Streptomyces dangxiongensis]